MLAILASLAAAAGAAPADLPAICFPVQRWNGREYANQRFEYEGKPCRPGR